MVARSSAKTVPDPVGEKRVALHGLDWSAYQQMKALLNERSRARLTYDRGTLEITKPSEFHEIYARLIERLIVILVVELGLKLKTMGSTTLDRPDLDRGAEPDNAYYIQNQPKVAGREVNLAQDPPPDLVVEVDISHADIDKPRLYASMGVPEFWRFDGRVWQIYVLQAGEYVESSSSPTFPQFSKEDLYQFLEACQEDEAAADVNFRGQVRE